jgi:NTP pyrophosphatase (non-canonical NTP hydrolase)
MLDHAQFLLTKLAEECAEVAQRALKQIQFGAEESQATNSINAGRVFTDEMKPTNAQRLRGEINDLVATIDLLTLFQEIPVVSDAELLEIKKAKWEKITRYQEYSRKLGKVE